MHNYAPSEFVEICMHALRWPAVREEFQKMQREAIDRNDWCSEPVYRHYLEGMALTLLQRCSEVSASG